MKRLREKHKLFNEMCSGERQVSAILGAQHYVHIQARECGELKEELKNASALGHEHNSAGLGKESEP